MNSRILTIISRGQSENPVKRQLESDLGDALEKIDGSRTLIIPNLYDLPIGGDVVQAIRAWDGPIVVYAWLFERAARWVLDRNGISGHEGEVLLKSEDDDEDEVTNEDDEEEKERVLAARELPKRRIYCVNLRDAQSVEPFAEEFQRIAQVSSEDELHAWIDRDVPLHQMQRFLQPTNDTALNTNTEAANVQVPVLKFDESPGRRWYPVIDFSRCTNCMECIDFCLFGVYGVDTIDTILVEQPDNCRKGCPACSRVCPENAIIFPQHKTPAIAGADVEVGGLKIDLSRLFGAPDEDATKVAARERDEQLVMAGRDAVGLSVGIPKRQADKPVEPKDDLDNLIDGLDDLDL
jgi:NAD-dependent dihydropyrimidine dehydrogenase PreA subunit